MQVISADGMNVHPVMMRRFLIAVAETYDVIITVPEKGAYEFRATAQDGSGFSSLFIGTGDRIAAPGVPKPDLYKMHGGGHDAMQMGGGMEEMMHHEGMAMPVDERPLPPYDELRYEGTEPGPQITAIRGNLFKKHWYFWAETSLLTQMTDGRFTAADTRNTLSAEWEAGWNEDYEAVFTYERYFTRFFQSFTGGVLTDGEQKDRGIIGIRYLLPLLFESSLWLDTEGDVRLSLENSIRLTDRLYAFGEFQYDTESKEEWLAGAGWTINRYLSIIGQYHSEYKGGVGVNIRY